MMQTRRERLREATTDEITTIARQQMRDAGGAEAISLRAIATQMGMSVGAIYRYFPSRDDLLTTLIVDAYTSLGDATTAAATGHPSDDYGGRFLAAAIAYRAWAQANPSEFDLIFGQPIPGYHAPDAPTVSLVHRAFAPFIAAVYEGWQAGQVAIPSDYLLAPPALLTHLAVWDSATDPAFLPIFQFTLAKWGLMHGLVALELNGQFGPMPTEAVAVMYAFEVRSLLKSIGLTVTA